MPLRRTVAAWLEDGSLPRAWTAIGSKAYARLAARFLCRPMTLPRAVDVIGVGGAVLGGSGKTPVVVACAKALSQAGRRVAVVAHGYKAFPGRIRVVTTSDRVEEVGDDALLMARALANGPSQVWVGPSRERTLLAAANHADAVVVDGLLQTSPVRLACSLLVLDAMHPWGSGRCLPGGDLRVAPAQLLAACDQIVVVSDPALHRVDAAHNPWPGAIQATTEIVAFSDSNRMISLVEARQARLGVLLLVARPKRVLASLNARGIRWHCSWLGADHHAPGPWDRQALVALARRNQLDAWLVTPKCRTHLCSDLGAPVWTIETSVHLDPQPWTVLDSPPCVRPKFSLHW